MRGGRILWFFLFLVNDGEVLLLWYDLNQSDFHDFSSAVWFFNGEIG